jgi:glycosyltransferase involved in cell wall biosynthesis
MPTAASQTVAVIIPAWNSARFIGRTLASVTAQTHRDLDIVVVDDGSTDETVEIVESHMRRHSRIRLFRESRRGTAGARNFGVRQTDAAFLAPCDHDDLWHPAKIERQLAVMTDAPESTALVYCWSLGINDRDEVILPFWTRATAEGRVLHEMIADNLPGTASCPLIRRTAFDAVGGFAEEASGEDDWILHIALAAQFEVRVIPDYLVAYRLLDGAQSLDVDRMEVLCNRATEWIMRNWPDLPPQVLRDRAWVVNRYLTFQAIRSKGIPAAARYLVRAFRAKPSAILTLDALLTLLLFPGRILGIRRYYPDFWRQPRRWVHAPPDA